MKHTVLFLALVAASNTIIAADSEDLQQEIKRLQQETKALQMQLDRLQQKMIAHHVKHNTPSAKHKAKTTAQLTKVKAMKEPIQVAQGAARDRGVEHHFKETAVSVHTPTPYPEGKGYYPTALMANERIITYIAGTPVVTSPYLGDRPAFDGSDYIVNISSINRDIRLMQQRRKLYRAYENIGYPIPNIPIIALSGKSEPVATLNKPVNGNSQGDLSLGSSELDVAAALNEYVEAFMSIAYNDSPPLLGGQRVSNSAFGLNLGFVNIGNLDKSPFYFTAGQLYAPYGRYSSSMISSPITLVMARTKTRPFIFGYKSQTDPGPYAAVYGFVSDTTLGRDGVGGVNLGYSIAAPSSDVFGDIGVGLIGSLNDAQGMQLTGSAPGTTFGGFGSPFNGSEAVKKIPGANIHGNISFGRYSLTGEWVGATRAFRTQDLSFNGRGAKPQALQLEGGVTFRAFEKPASIGLGYQWSKDTLALNLPQQRISGVFNISIWKDTVESLEYRHDIDYSSTTFANGAAPPGVVNANTFGTGGSSNTLVAQIGVYF